MAFLAIFQSLEECHLGPWGHWMLIPAGEVLFWGP